MKLVKTAIAGTFESSDIYVKIEPKDTEGIEIDLSSPVKEQFGDQITKVAQEVLKAHKVENAFVELKDSGALDCVIRARLECAISRAVNEDEAKVDWEELAKWIN